MNITADAGIAPTGVVGSVVCAVALGLWLCQTADAQIGLAGASDADWTVVTMAPDGAWGTATEGSVNQAIANAVTRCRSVSRLTLGCGAYMVSTQGGWVLGLRCSGENILRAGRTLADAVESARRREIELRPLYRPELASCQQVLIVAPDGSIKVPQSQDAISDSRSKR